MVQNDVSQIDYYIDRVNNMVGKVEQTVNIRISLDKSRNTEKDILLNQSKIDPYAFSYKRSVLKSTSTWAQRNPGVFVLLGMPLTLAVLFFAIE